MRFTCRSGPVCLLWLGLVCAGCQQGEPAAVPGGNSSSGGTDGGYGGYGGYGDYGYGAREITFLDSAPANVTDAPGLSDLTFTRSTGETTRVRDLAGPRGVVVVVTRGNTNPICPYCSTQTAHYIRDYARFQERGLEVLLVYPVEVREDSPRLEAFLTDARTRLGDPQRPVPFPVLFDVELTAVNHLGIRKDLSKPATYIVDSGGNVRYAYVGSHWGDRPTAGAVAREADRLGIGLQPDTNAANTSAANTSETKPEEVTPAATPGRGDASDGGGSP